MAITWSEAPKIGFPATRPKYICNYFKITSVRAYHTFFLLPIRIGLKHRPRLICALVFRARTEVYECYTYTRRDHRVWGLSLENTGEGGEGVTVI